MNKTGAKPTARDRWVAENTTRVAIKLNHHTDADILSMLAAAESKAGLIKKALRAYKEKEDRD